MKKNILITGVGGGGSNNLVESLKLSNLDFNEYKLLGSNIDAEILAKSPLEDNYILPVATDSSYMDELIKLIKYKNIDLIIPNNDREIGKVSELRDQLGCKVFLPEHNTILACHDKYEMYQRLQSVQIPMAKSIELKSFSDIEPAIAEIGGDKFWVRPKIGSGSKGATWVKTSEQAVNWIKLWIDLRGFQLEEFTISEFLPGKDYCFQSVWKDGQLMVAKMCERLSYFFGANRLSGMSSTPAVAKTVRDDKALEIIFKSINCLSEMPNGNFSFDLKGRANGEMCITECNVGRFCMITPIFDRTGKYSTPEIYIRSAFDDPSLSIDEPIDIDEGYYLLRELDTLPTIIHEREIQRIQESAINRE